MKKKQWIDLFVYLVSNFLRISLSYQFLRLERSVFTLQDRIHQNFFVQIQTFLFSGKDIRELDIPAYPKSDIFLK